MRFKTIIPHWIRRIALVFMIGLTGFTVAACGSDFSDRINEFFDELTERFREQIEEQLEIDRESDFYEFFDYVVEYHYDQPQPSDLWLAAIQGLLSGVTDSSLVEDISETLDINVGNEDTFLLVFAAINEFDESDLTEDDFWLLAMQAVLSSLNDPYSRYVRFEDYQALLQGSQESFIGVGVGVQEANNNVRIVHIFPNSPAEGAGLMPGDVITHVDGIDVRDSSYEMTLSLVLGEEDTAIELGIKRPGLEEILTVNMIRSEIPTPTAVGELIEVDEQLIGYLRINTFGEQTAAITEDILEGFIDAGYEGLIIDVRNNSGGALGTLNDLLALFMQGSEEEPFFTIDWIDSDVPQKFFSVGDPLVDVPMVLMTNGFSASASEVFASALHERGGVEILGETTFGKGSVQKGFQLGGPLGDFVWLTVGNWFTSAGVNVRDIGYEPTIPVEQNPYLTTPSIFVGEAVYEAGDTHELIEVAQQILKALGYGEFIELNGVLDSATVTALENFQFDNDLPVNGVLDGPTAVALTTAITQYRNNPIHDTQRQAAVAFLESLLSEATEPELRQPVDFKSMRQSPIA